MFFNRRRKIKELEEKEKKRIKECNEILEAIALELGYIARKIISRNELKRLIDQGAEPPDLFQYVIERLKETPGTILGYHYFGEDVPLVDIKLIPSLREKHIYIIGKTGSGKTNLLRNLVFQDIVDGAGVGVITPEIDFITDGILPYIPEARIKDVIYFDPADKRHPLGFNPLDMNKGEDIDKCTDDLLTIFQRSLGEAGPRMLPILRNSFYALLERKGSTFLDMYKLLSRSEPSLREEIIENTQNPTVARFFYEDYPSMDKNAHLPITNRLDSFVGSNAVRNILCSPASSFSLSEVMDDKKIILFNLSDGILGQENSQLIGQLIVSKFQQSLMARANIPEKRRVPFTLYIDEFQSFTSAAQESYEKILSRARKYKMTLVLAHQQTKQIPEPLIREILGNISTLISFNISFFDARRIAKEFIDQNVFNEISKLDPERLLLLGVGEAYCRIGKHFFKLWTYLDQKKPDPAIRRKVVKISQENYGQKPLIVDNSFFPGGKIKEPQNFRE
jgi:hypothetical protein